MGVDVEKELSGEEIVHKEDEDSDPEDEESGENGGENGDGGGEDEEEEDEEELEDPVDKIRESCGDRPDCSKFKRELEVCNERVNGKSATEETCVQELFDFLECQEKCVAHRLFSKLK